MAALQSNVKTRSAADYRTSYLNHITRYWRTWQDVTGIVALKKISEMQKIETSYVQPRDTNFAVTLTPDVVILPRDALERSGEGAPSPMSVSLQSGNLGQFRLTAGGFRLRR